MMNDPYAPAGCELTPGALFAKFARMSLPRVLFCFLFILAATAPDSIAMGRRQKSRALLMGVLGDSISAGTLSDLPLKPCAKDAAKSAKRPGGVSAKFIYENKEKLSWASGRSVSSHFYLLKSYLLASGSPDSLRVENVSSPGDRTRDLPKQAAELMKQYREGNYSALTYATILIGANDACGKKGATPLDRMRAELLQTFAKIAEIQQEEPIRILLVGIPRIPDLGAPAIRRTHTPLLGLRCGVVRDRLLGSCRKLLSWRTEEEYHQAMNIVEERNRLLRSTAIEANATFPNLEIVYSNHLFDLEIPPAMLAIDCFHPSKRGQEAISREVWLDQPWFWMER
ncbi:MAG: hypothetical protein A2X94_08640 [Bdellovibrionales bacterium GWB1_55_8]|nr:MAG: hypothetical protein A2X94_08640 [Bdellovibrionales bacterium GWB1_55_8]